MKKQLSMNYSGMTIVCDYCGEPMTVDWVDDNHYTQHNKMPFYNGDSDGSHIKDEADIEGWLFVDGKDYCPNCWDYSPCEATPDKFRNQYDDYEGLLFTEDGNVYQEIATSGLENEYKKLT